MADYNINAVTRRVVYTGSAGLGPYAFSFEVLDQNDIAVYFNTTKLTITTDYTVTINANGTGSVTIVTGSGVPSTPTSSDTITIVGARDIERTTDFVTAGDLRAAALNEQLDGLTIFDQQLAEENKRTLKAPVTDPAHVDEGGTLDMTLPSKTARAGKYLQFNSTTGNPEAGPDSADVTTLADIATDIATLADIEDGTENTDAIQTVAGISSNVSTVAGIASNVSTVAGISSAVSSVAADATDIGTVASNISSVNTVAGNISYVVTVANDLTEAVSEVETVANDLNEAVSEIETVAASISNVDTVGTNISNVNTVAGISSNVTTVAGISSNVTTVAGISANVTTVAGISSDVTTVAADGTDIGTVATNISNVNTVAGISSNVTTVAGNNANVTTVASNIANVNTVASNITGVNSFADRYRVAASDPATSLDEGDLAYNTTDNALKYYNGTSWNSITPGIGNVVEDTTPQLGGNLDLNGNDITGTGNINNTGTITTDGLTVDTTGIVYSSGNVGIGTSSPGAKLHVGGGSLQQFIENTSGSGIARLNIQSTTNDGYQHAGIGLQDGTNQSELMLVTGNNFAIAHGGSERMRITSAGAVGIGTSSPSQSLHVIGEGLFEKTSADSVVAVNSTGGSGRSYQIRSQSSGDFYIYDNTAGSARVVVNSSGNVGIGTSSPSVLLHLKQTTGNAILRLNSDSGERRIDFGDTTDDDGGRIKYDGSDNLALYTNGSERMRIDSSGNVGIGDSTPDAKLDVYSSSGSTTDIGRFEAAVGGYTGTSLIAANTLGPASTYNLFKCISDSDGDAGGPYTEFVVRGDGNVGIGTSSPSQALDVVGSIEVSGGVYLGGTGASNLLDDYEEGTWTPTYDAGYPGGTPEEVNEGCQYVKVGNIVHITGKIQARNDGTAMQLGGLPFAIASSSSASCSVSHASHTVRHERVDAGTSVIRWVFSGTSGSLQNQFFAATYVTN